MPTETIDRFILRMKSSNDPKVLMKVARKICNDGSQFTKRYLTEPDKEAVLSDVEVYELRLKSAGCNAMASRFRMIAGLPNAD